MTLKHFLCFPGTEEGIKNNENKINSNKKNISIDPEFRNQCMLTERWNYQFQFLPFPIVLGDEISQYHPLCSKLETFKRFKTTQKTYKVKGIYKIAACLKEGHAYFRFLMCVSHLYTIFTLSTCTVVYSTVASCGLNVSPVCRNVILLIFLSSAEPNKPQVFKVFNFFQIWQHPFILSPLICKLAGEVKRIYKLL